MFRELLCVSLDSIESLQQFYLIQKEQIDSLVAEGVRKYSLGAAMDSYFSALTSADEDFKQTGIYTKLEETVLEYVEVKSTEISEDGRTVVFKYKSADALDKLDIEKNISLAAKKFRQYGDMPRLHANNTLVMLLVRYEEFISDILASIYHLFPQKYLDNKEIKLSEIGDMKTDEIREYIIERELDATMRDSFMSWFKLFESHKMSFDACKSEIANLAEIYARRNVIVHNSGRVNSSYKKLVQQSEAQIGDYLFTDENYLYNAFSVIKTIMFTIIIESARLLKSGINEFLGEIFSLAFQELQEKNYATCYNIFAQLSQNKGLDEITRQMSKVNYWIAKIELYGRESVKEDVINFDVSALDKSFLLAKQLLLEQYDQATQLLEILLTKDEIGSTAITTWPLFLHYRETEYYTDFKQRHADEFDVASFAPEEDPCGDCTTDENSVGEQAVLTGFSVYNEELEVMTV